MRGWGAPGVAAVLGVGAVLSACAPGEPSAGAAVPPLAAAASSAEAPAAPPVADAAGCYLGVVLASESVEVVAEVAGRVREVAVRPGDAVAAGALLATLSPDDLRHQMAIERAELDGARSALAEAEVEVRRAGEEHRRRQALADLVSREAIDAAAFDVEAASRRRDGAAADLAAVRARIDRLERELARADVRAPFAGTVALRHVDPGAVVAPGAPLVRLDGDGAPRVRFAVPPEEAERLERGQVLAVELESPALVRVAALERVAAEIDAASQSVFVEARLERPAAGGPALPAGAIVRVSPAGEAPPDSCFARAARGGAGRLGASAAEPERRDRAVGPVRHNEPV